MKKIILYLIPLFVGCVTTSNKSELYNNQQSNSHQNEVETQPLLMLETQRGIVMANNISEKYFKLFLEGDDLKLKKINDNLIYIVDDFIVQQLVIDLNQDLINQFTHEEILRSFAYDEIKYFEDSINEELELTNQYSFKSDDGEQTIFIWGYHQPESLKNSNLVKNAKVQLFVASVYNDEYILGFNSIVFNDDNPDEIAEKLIKIIATVKSQINPINESALEKYYIEDIQPIYKKKTNISLKSNKYYIQDLFNLNRNDIDLKIKNDTTVIINKDKRKYSSYTSIQSNDSLHMLDEYSISFDISVHNSEFDFYIKDSLDTIVQTFKDGKIYLYKDSDGILKKIDIIENTFFSVKYEYKNGLLKTYINDKETSPRKFANDATYMHLSLKKDNEVSIRNFTINY